METAPSLPRDDDHDSSSDNDSPSVASPNGTVPHVDSTAPSTADGSVPAAKKKPKKKKKKTPNQKVAAAAANAAPAPSPTAPAQSVLKISRSKHMKLPSEVLDSLLSVNCDPEALPTVRGLMEAKSSHSIPPHERSRQKALLHSPSSSYFFGEDEHLPPPIDPAVFRGVTEIRKLVDDASDLAVRAASGLSAAALGALNINSGMGGSGGNSLGMEGSAGGRNVAMSPIRQHRLRSLAVAKLAEAFKIDEIAAAVAVMQGATGLDDLAIRVMKYDPGNLDAQYVHFFHEKIPSRTLAISTDTTLLDQLIQSNPHRLEYYRTRGIVHGFKQDYPAAIRNFTQALSQAKASRKAKQYHAGASGGEMGSKSSKKKNGKGSKSSNGKEKSTTESPPPTTASVPARDEATSIGKEPGDDIERQMLFHRGMAHFHYACKLLEDAVLDIEEVDRPQGGLSNEGGELTLRNVGINLKDEDAGLYGCASAKKQEKYRTVLGDPEFKEKITTLLRKSVRDQERFLSYFSIWEAPPGSILEDEKRYHNPRSTDKPLTFRGRRLIHHRSLSGRTRHADPRRTEQDRESGSGSGSGSGSAGNGNGNGPTQQGEPALLTTYHPLLIEAHFSVLLNHLLLGDWSSLVLQHYKISRLMEYLEGYPVFLPARSLNQSEYAELLERLASTWLRKREESGIPSPPGTEEEVSRDGDLKSLHHLLSFFTEDFIEALVAAAEKADLEAKEEARAKTSSNTLLALLDQGTKEPKGTWAEEREKAEANRRKIDPSYATYNTARAEVALAWLTCVVLPQKEAEEADEKVDKGKGKERSAGTNQNGNASASGSRTMYHDEEEEED